MSVPLQAYTDKIATTANVHTYFEESNIVLTIRPPSNSSNRKLAGTHFAAIPLMHLLVEPNPLLQGGSMTLKTFALAGLVSVFVAACGRDVLAPAPAALAGTWLTAAKSLQPKGSFTKRLLFVG